MSDRNFDLNRRNVLLSMGTVGAAGAMGAGTWAQFTDTETKRVTVKAGSLDLRVDGKNGVIEVGHGPLVGGQCTGIHCEKLTNVGATPGESLGFELHDVVDYEMGGPDAERAAEGKDSLPYPGKGKGELSNYLQIFAFLVCKTDGKWTFEPIFYDDSNDPADVSAALSDGYEPSTDGDGSVAGDKDDCWLAREHGINLWQATDVGRRCVEPTRPLGEGDWCKFCYQLSFEDVPANDAMTDKTTFDVDVSLGTGGCENDDT